MQIPNEFSISSLSFKYKDYTHKFRIRLLRKLNNFIQKEFKHLKTLPPNELITNLNKFEKYIDYRNCLSSCISVLANKNNLYLGLPETISTYYKKYKTYIIAEVGPNHNGSLDMAISYIDELSKIGVNAVKFQLTNPYKLFSNNSFMAFCTFSALGIIVASKVLFNGMAGIFSAPMT